MDDSITIRLSMLNIFEEDTPVFTFAGTGVGNGNTYPTMYDTSSYVLRCLEVQLLDCVNSLGLDCLNSLSSLRKYPQFAAGIFFACTGIENAKNRFDNFHPRYHCADSVG